MVFVATASVNQPEGLSNPAVVARRSSTCCRSTRKDRLALQPLVHEDSETALIKSLRPLVAIWVKHSHSEGVLLQLIDALPDSRPPLVLRGSVQLLRILTRIDSEGDRSTVRLAADQGGELVALDD